MNTLRNEQSLGDSILRIWPIETENWRQTHHRALRSHDADPHELIEFVRRIDVDFAQETQDPHLIEIDR